MPTKLVLLVTALALFGCAGSFEEARLVAPSREAAARPASVTAPASSSDDRCVTLDDRRQLWGAVAKGSAVVAGSAGLSTIPAKSDNLKIGLASAGVAAAALAAGSIYVSELAGDRWVAECSGGGK